MRKIAIIAGTTEGRKLAEYFDQKGEETHIFVASQYGQEVLPELALGQIHVGRMDDDEFAKAFKEYGITCVYDATHPYAKIVTQTVKAVCERDDIAYERILRDEIDVSMYLQDNEYVRVDQVGDAVHYLQEKDGNVFAAIGSKEAVAFTALDHYEKRVVLRVLPGEKIQKQLCQDGFSTEQIVTGVGPFSQEENEQLLTKYQIKYMVTKESGTAGGFVEKILAAREQKVFVILIKRPKEQGIYIKDIIGE